MFAAFTDFGVDVERVMTMLVLTIFGGAVRGGLIGDIGWSQIVFAACILVVVRPLAVLIAAPGTRLDGRERLAAGYLGIRGLASLYYVIYAAEQNKTVATSGIESVVALVVLMSAILYGATADLVMRRFPTERAVGQSDREAQ